MCFKKVGVFTATKARLACQEVDASLPVPRNEQQNADYRSAFDKVLGTKDSYVWLGIDDKAVEGEFVDEQGQKVTPVKWAKRQPDNWAHKEHYVHMKSGGEWNDIYETARLYTVCVIPRHTEGL